MKEKNQSSILKTSSATTSQYAEALISLKGKPLSFEGREPFRIIYDIDVDSMTLKCGRQIGKSVSLAGILTLKGLGRNYFNSLYVAPLSDQTKRFSTAYLNPFLNSPLIRRYFLDKNSTKNVFEKSFSNGSRIYLAYAQTEADADRIRGINSDMCNFDEVQDIAWDSLPTIYETMSASPFAYKRFTGTSKNINNTLEYLFLNSNQLEWVVKCPHCNHHIIPNDTAICLKIVSDPKGPSCPKCGKLISMSTGRWIAMRPDIKDEIGFHIPQFAIPFNTTPKQWTKLFKKIQSGSYTRVKLNNEVFGLADDVAGKSLSMSEVQACCNPSKLNWDTHWPMDERRVNSVVVGVDWSVTGGVKSYTVITVIGADYTGKIYLLFAERLQGTDILEQVARVAEVYRMFNAQIIASDRGVGVLQAQLLQREFGTRACLPINYVAAKTHYKWDGVGGFMAADRTQAIDNMIVKIKSGKARFECPAWSVTAPLWADALNIYEEETQAGKRVYRKDPETTDDFLHSLVFANIGYQIISGDYSFLD